MDGNLSKGLVSNIQKFSINDGEGIRSTIFLSGCPLECKWCANPETKKLTQRSMYYRNKCKHCNACIEACDHDAIDKVTYHIDENKCVKCNRCVSSCQYGARSVNGYYMSVDEVIDEVKGDFIFFSKSGGGITFSGGEPTLQIEFLGEMVTAFYERGIDMAIETCGYFLFEKVEWILKKMDMIFVDIKHYDKDEHRKLTGVDNDIILSNICKIGKLNKNLVVRIPVLNGINSDEENIAKTARFVKENIDNPKIELLPYHEYGKDKYEALNLSYPYSREQIPSQNTMERLIEIIKSTGVEVLQYK